MSDPAPEIQSVDQTRTDPESAPAGRSRKRIGKQARRRGGTPSSSDRATPWGTLSQVSRESGKLPPKLQAPILSLVVLVVGIGITVPFLDDDTSPIAIVIVGLLCGTVRLLSDRRDGQRSALMVFVFTLIALFLLKPPHDTVDPPVPRGEADRSVVAVSGTIYDISQRKMVPGATVGVDGYSKAVALTDGMGRFHLEVPRFVFPKNRVTLIVQSAVDTIFDLPLSDLPFRLRINSAAAVAFGGEGPRPFLAAGITVPPRGGPPQSRVDLRVVVDSIRTLTPGGSEPQRWGFEVKVKGNGDYHIPAATYSSAAGRNVMLVAGERRFRVSDRGIVWIRIEGTRQRNLLSSYLASGVVRVPMETLRPNLAFKARADVKASNPADGRFLVYMTVIRQAPAVPARAQ